MSSLETNLGKVKLKNPILLASGTCGVAAREFEPYFKLSDLGSIVTKSLSIKPRVGNPTPRVVEVSPACGMLNSIGLQNPGIEYFVKNELPYLTEQKVTCVINIVGETLDDYLQAVDVIKNKSEFCAIELNLSCPNVEGGLDFSQDPKKAFTMVSEVKKITNIPVWAKLSPNITDITEIAKACIDAGSDGLCLINTVLGLAINRWTKKPVLPRGVGGYSGPAIKPIALRMIWETYKKFPKTPIIGIGGIHTTDDAIEFLLCGASAIQIGTANFVNPKASIEIIEGLKKYMEQMKISSINEIVGQAHLQSEKPLAKSAY
ncbi:MAG: dihydroorotate dehydrogenase B catalytic subunit [Candidatus Melainabacteria bacterium RIFCSPHIGHO2_02_FULL_34_12]|nr:MAG: dihydroorotate dehydrogenase B catalytic subunit [Candidatus Melainabacteria bacterium RIFCSPHIGHO2_02_FULL_34_12]